MAGTKRKEAPTKAKSPTKKAKAEIPDYHLTPSVKDENGDRIWPAPEDQMAKAREIIKECAAAGKKTLIVPDKDADGLSSGVILYRTLQLLGLDPDLITIHLLQKGNNVHSESERQLMAESEPSYIFVLDQGSRASGPVIDNPHTALVIDHHHATATDFPRGSFHVTACNSPPVATSSLLTYTLCNPLHESVSSQTDWLCIIGTHGDLGNTLKWAPPFPDMTTTLKTYTKKLLNDVVSVINAPRRTATYDVISAWTALLSAIHPSEILKNTRLRAARDEVNAEVERCTHTAPKFSADGKVALFRIQSEAQVHPVIATRWAGHLNSKALEIVMVANEGYVPGVVNFSCRIARCARGREEAVDIIRSLKEYASLVPEGDEAAETKTQRTPLIERLGDNFARGHVQASGGIVSAEHFEELVGLMKIGVKAEKKEGEGQSPKKARKGTESAQKNTLMNYFGKPAVQA